MLDLLSKHLNTKGLFVYDLNRPRGRIEEFNVTQSQPPASSP